MLNLCYSLSTRVSGTVRRVRAFGRVRRFGVLVKDGESCVVSAGEANIIDGYFGMITVRKWSMYC
jgi:hypothetical protein